MPKVVALAVKIRKTSDSALKSRGVITPVELSSSSPSWRFQPGKSGNPRGRPPGTANHGHLRLRSILAENAEAVIYRVVREARDGDMYAARLVLDRVLPRRVCRPPMGLNLSQLMTATDASAALAKIVNGAADGLLSTAEAAEMAKVIGVFNGSLVVNELTAKIELLEAQLNESRR